MCIIYIRRIWYIFLQIYHKVWNENKALIVDDNSDFVVSLYKYMQSQIPELDIVSLASNGEEAIKYIDEINPDIVFLDLDMPKLSGIEVLKK